MNGYVAALLSPQQILAEWPWQGKIAGRSAPTTMTKDDIQLLYEYDRWANNRVLQAASTLSADILACLAYAADRERKLEISKA